ncbi:MAG: hypothetical protein WAX04_07970 [Oscillospiraceae bacterium]
MSEYEKYKKDRQKLVEVAKVKMSTPDGGAGAIKEDYQPLKPTTFQGKWQNYWYHYKWLTFGSIIATILIVMFAWQVIFKTVNDAQMTLVTEVPFDSMAGSFETKLSNIATDYTKNGKIDIDIIPIQQDITGKNLMSPEMAQANYVKLAAGLSTLDSFIYMVDESSYNYLKTLELSFMDLSELVDPGKLDKPDRYAIKGTNLAEKLDIGPLSDNMYLCFVNYGALDEKRQNKKNIKTAYERDIVFFEDLLAYK